jgi:8-oxoguanine DNA glycosylase-like protein/DUF2934 family protein
MHLSDFRSLIASMPTAYHATTSKRSTWKATLTLQNPAAAALDSIFQDFGGQDEVCISRSDLRRLAREPKLDRFVMATIVWGYERGDRFQNITQFARHPTGLAALTNFLNARRTVPITQWSGHLQTLPVKGIGLSTYTKFINFLSINVCGNTALILDRIIARVFENRVFPELFSLGINVNNKEAKYPEYLTCIHQISNELRVPAENIEFFLFHFGLIIKGIEQNIRLLAYEFYEQRGKADGEALDDWLKFEAEVRGIR